MRCRASANLKPIFGAMIWEYYHPRVKGDLEESFKQGGKDQRLLISYRESEVLLKPRAESF